MSIQGCVSDIHELVRTDEQGAHLPLRLRSDEGGRRIVELLDYSSGDLIRRWECDDDIDLAHLSIELLKQASGIASEPSASDPSPSRYGPAVAALERIAKRGGITSIPDPDAWLREIREDRPLPGRPE